MLCSGIEEIIVKLGWLDVLCSGIEEIIVKLGLLYVLCSWIEEIIVKLGWLHLLCSGIETCRLTIAITFRSNVLKISQVTVTAFVWYALSKQHCRIPFSPACNMVWTIWEKSISQMLKFPFDNCIQTGWSKKYDMWSVHVIPCQICHFSYAFSGTDVMSLRHSWLLASHI